MNLKQAQAILSDLLMKCEEENVHLPKDPFDTMEAALEALQAETSHEMSGEHLQAALARLRKQCGVIQRGKVKTSSSKPEAQEAGVKKRKGRPSTAGTKAPAEATPEAPSGPRLKKTEAISSTTSPTTRGRKTTKIMEEIQSSPAKNPANQKLVDQMAELGEYESKIGHTQRGTSRMRAAKQLKEATEEIKSGAQARKLDRIGPSAAAKIEEILLNGLEGALEEYEHEITEESQDTSPRDLASPPPHHTDEEDRRHEEEDEEERDAEEEARRQEAMEEIHELEDANAEEEEQQEGGEDEAYVEDEEEEEEE